MSVIKILLTREMFVICFSLWASFCGYCKYNVYVNQNDKKRGDDTSIIHHLWKEQGHLYSLVDNTIIN